MAKVSIAAFDSFFLILTCNFIKLERFDAVLNDHLLAIQTKFIPLLVYCFSKDDNIFSILVFVFNFSWILFISKGSSEAKIIASTCLSSLAKLLGNFKTFKSFYTF